MDIPSRIPPGRTPPAGFFTASASEMVKSTAIVWQEALLAASRVLPLQKDIPNLLRMLKNCCDPLMAFQRIHIVIAAPMQEKARLYMLDAHADRSAVSEQDLTPQQGLRQFWSQTEVACFEGEHLRREFPAIADLDQYRNASGCLFVPISTQGGCHCAMDFVKTDGSVFSDDSLVFFRVLAGVVTAAITAILCMDNVRQETEHLRRERDHFSILVDVTNTAIGTLEMNDMVAVVAGEIRRFFGIRDFALLLHETDDTFSFHCARPPQSTENPVLPAGTFSLSNSLLKRCHDINAPLLARQGDLARLSRKDPASEFILGNGNQAAGLFPLHFGQHCLGAMLLAHRHPDVFTDESVSLLAQIASRVAIAVRNALDYTTISVQKNDLAQENLYLSEQIQSQSDMGVIIGQSDAIMRVLQQVDMVASSDSTVLLLGETGTGKELFAQAIHNRSPRKSKRMVKMNCAAVPAGLMESELFGHEKGAFTGAGAQRKGRFELAHGSTLMLDEVGDIPLELQPKLLRVLQSREIERLGGHKVISVDVRLVAATNRNLQEMVLDGTFRDDLFYRLNVFPIAIPPLRERREDIPLLAKHFTQQMARQMKKNITNIPSAALRWLCDQPWPGNVRELANVIERAVILSSGPSLNICPLEVPAPVAAISQRKQEASAPPAPAQPIRPVYTDAHHQPGETLSERDRIVAAILACNGVMAGSRGVAAMLGLKRTTLLSRMQRMGIDIKDVLETRGQSLPA